MNVFLLQKRKSQIYVIGAFILLAVFLIKGEVSANSIYCGVFMDKDGIVNNANGTYYCDQLLYMKCAVDDGAYAIDYVTLTISGGSSYVFNDYGKDYSSIVHSEYLTKPGTYVCKWIGKWANQSQTFEIQNVITIKDRVPVVNTQPSDVTTENDNSVRFSVTASGTNLKYQWYYKKGLSGNEVLISGATSNSYTVKASASVSGRYYYCKISNESGVAVTKAAKLTTYYKVNYNANGGNGAPDSQTKYCGETLRLSNVKPVRSGYTFLGWSTNNSAATAMYKAGESYISDSAVTLYAVWERIQYKVTYNANGGVGEPDPQIKYYGEALSLSSVEPVQEGYRFLGWSKNSEAVEILYSAGDKYGENSNVILYAVWLPTGQSKPESSITEETITEEPKPEDLTTEGTITEESKSEDLTTEGAITEESKSEDLITGKTNNHVKKKQQILAADRKITYKKKKISLRVAATGGGKLIYKSNNPSIITITADGKITAKNYGKASITIKALENSDYQAAEKKITISVVPQTINLKKVKSSKKKTVSITWKKDKTVSGYEIYISEQATFKKKTWKRLCKASKNRMSLTGFDSGKTYYVKVRAYKKLGKKKYISEWGKVKKVRVK